MILLRKQIEVKKSIVTRELIIKRQIKLNFLNNKIEKKFIFKEIKEVEYETKYEEEKLRTKSLFDSEPFFNENAQIKETF